MPCGRRWGGLGIQSYALPEIALERRLPGAADPDTGEILLDRRGVRRALEAAESALREQDERIRELEERLAELGQSPQ